MPTYEYQCLACGKRLTVVQGIKEEKLTVHEGCGGELERLISGGRLLITPRKGGAPESDDFTDTPGGWEDGFDDDPGGYDNGMDEFGGAGGMEDLGDMGPLGGMGGMGGGLDEFGADDADGAGFDDDLDT